MGYKIRLTWRVRKLSARLLCKVKGHKWKDDDGWMLILGTYDGRRAFGTYDEYIVCRRCGTSKLNPDPVLAPITADEEGTMIIGFTIEPKGWDEE